MAPACVHRRCCYQMLSQAHTSRPELPGVHLGRLPAALACMHRMPCFQTESIGRHESKCHFASPCKGFRENPCRGRSLGFMLPHAGLLPTMAVRICSSAQQQAGTSPEKHVQLAEITRHLAGAI